MELHPQVRASLVAQTNPTYLGYCDPGAGVGYRIAFYGEGIWEQVETAFPVMTHEEARALIAAAEQLTERLMTRIAKARAA
ncbi:hypothetical protein [Brevundimonas viscosa]|uniref:Uncharacterized protein n=1 Tax=Brevundimonas viscosa TaxID=871741 RepID=A0A1I6PRG2_9CAUL|nr:hypothetical protein [Brevundimonas viscosa]SFS42797.1 hypothetical protein SAMN05192570_1213 [Brevundimonas viscosa]